MAGIEAANAGLLAGLLLATAAAITIHDDAVISFDRFPHTRRSLRGSGCGLSFTGFSTDGKKIR